MSNETCDRCGTNVAAAVRVRLPSGKTLTFCQHHANQYRKAIIRRCPAR